MLLLLLLLKTDTTCKGSFQFNRILLQTVRSLTCSCNYYKSWRLLSIFGAFFSSLTSYVCNHHHHHQLSCSLSSSPFLVCSYGTRSDQMVISRWCTAPACGSLTGATPSSPSSMLTTPCCSCPVSTWAHTTPRLGRLLSSVWVGTKKIIIPQQSCIMFSC